MKPPVQMVYQQRAEQTTRSDVATINRSIQDLKNQASRLQNNLVSQMTQTQAVDMEDFKNAWQKREELNQLNQQITELEQKFKTHMPSMSNARLTDEERKQIKGLHSSGLYTQQQLADQYGVNQSTISDIVKK